MREKLIELLIETAPMDYKDSASYLIANGVTIPARCKDFGLCDETAGTDSLDGFSTRELILELECRVGVEKKTAKPYENVKINVNGPAIVLIVKD